MEPSVWFQWIAFGVLSLIAIAGALGMTTTMSMFRSGIFLMASFIGVAGLFILLGAPLIGMLQVMMYIGGMLVMILFMVLFSSDPGGSMMTSHMDLPPLEKLFSGGLAHDAEGGQKGEHEGEDGHEHGEGHDQEHQGGHHGDMSMFTPIKKGAAIFAVASGTALVLFVLLDRPWVATSAPFDPRSAERIGHLLMGKYMMAFEGAGLLILLGIFGAVFLQRPGSYPDSTDRESLRAAVDDPPPPIAPEVLKTKRRKLQEAAE